MAALGFVVAVALAIALGTALSWGMAYILMTKTGLLSTITKKSIEISKDIIAESLEIELKKGEEAGA